MPKNVVVATDTSEASHDACLWAVDNLCQDGDTLHLVHAFKPLMPAVGPHYSYVPTEAEQESWRKEQSECLKAESDRVKAAKPGVHIHAVLIEGDARDTLPVYAEQHQAVALVVGSRGKGAVSRALLGSVSTYLIHHSKTPVVVVHHKKTEDK